MTEEEEKLLLIDLAARVPYRVMVEQTLYPTFADKEQRLKSVQENNCVKLYWNKYNLDDFVSIHCIRPYLRPMSSMTDEERRFLLKFGTVGMDENDKVFDVYPFGMERTMSVVDFLNAHHFDYRGLIEKGLALEAPEGMYKTE